MTRKTRNWLIVVLLIPTVIVTAVAGLLVFQELRPLPPIQPLPQPNGYTGLVQAAGMISPESWDYAALDEAQLREIVSANAAALSVARASMSNECRVPIQFSPPNSEPAHLSGLAGLKRLAQAFTVEGKFAEEQRRFGDAAGSYLDVIRLGNNSARGGVLIDSLVGLAIENMGVAGLQKITGHSTPKPVVPPPQPWKRLKPKDNPGRTFCSRNRPGRAGLFPASNIDGVNWSCPHH